MFKQVPDDEPKFATYKAKWDDQYRKRWGIENEFADELLPNVVQKIQLLCKRIYRLLVIDGYARLDLRLTPQNEIVFIEANPNPILAREEDFAESARQANISYPELIERILQLGRTALRE
jgi:D-alanine-D-alanine ligase